MLNFYVFACIAMQTRHQVHDFTDISSRNLILTINNAKQHKSQLYIHIQLILL